MKLLSYQLKKSAASPRVGFMLHDKIVDMQEAWCLWRRSRQENDLADAAEQFFPSDPTRFYAAGDFVISQAKEAAAFVQTTNMEDSCFSRENVHLLTPVPEPSKIICIGKNYAEHAAEMKSDVPDYPVLFAKFANCLIGPEDAIEKSPKTCKLDYEVELTAVIGKVASQVRRENALDYIAGYTIGNDTSARDLQKRTPQWLQGKTLDRSTPVGPWIVTADEVGDPGNLKIQSLVNGNVRQSSSTSKLIFDVPFLIAFISGLITLKPGDLIMTGTPHGVAMGMDSPLYLRDGDVVTMEIENIGRLENNVID
ncbi:fumarylacetoacetate hydrolase family protein [Lentibacillus cibarius]|uniref:Fumarylacetoacetate hydrolase family protein n=1 Tax=Lentibacillus cibarius TaxID=2583219 RepID=A0A5S3QHB6_9BACI|nr:fumarylacetoacetate hydrolase family protein [Lentibacillus cibarius]TMN21280.1 fumarylacetoacetate hydrolase family protein [Lentibacillus cibarius]